MGLKIGEKRTVTIGRDDKIKVVAEFEVRKSGAFEYGNGTCVAVDCHYYYDDGERTFKDSYDTRYYHGTIDDLVQCWFEQSFDTEHFKIWEIRA